MQLTRLKKLTFYGPIVNNPLLLAVLHIHAFDSSLPAPIKH